ncbi:MAG: HD domain-containing protein, partial [Sporomusaceae bacterium]|nr:HD domain-containing protein [Sporomusaceae bacterium]
MGRFQVLFSLRSKLFFAFFSVSALITMTITYSLYSHMRTDHINTLSRGIMNIAAVTALQVDGDTLEQMVDPEQENLPEYIDIKERLNRIAGEIPDIKYIYTMRKTDQSGQYTFIVDADPDAESVAHIGDIYDGSELTAMAAGFVAPSADQEFVTDKWGTTLSGYAPVRNSNGEVVGVVGIDIDVETMIKELADFTYKVIYQSIVVIMLCAVAIFFISNRFARRFRLINKAVDELASGNCDIDLAVDGGDAIALLSARINNLAATLHTEREDMLLSTIKVLVNALEAKDKYTSGHSSEVEALTLEIARELRLPEKDIFNIAIAATLHDIGKIGIPDQVLHKQDKLTEEEWSLIKKHPSIGAAIIAGIPSLQEIAQIVMHHHARWDGTGYPQSISKTGIPIGARIIAVADSFQAMTSDRPYRKGMPI